MKYYFLSCILVILLFSYRKSEAQLNPERSAWSRLQDGKWESAHRLLQKSLKKDPANLAANYVLANWFFAPSNPNFQIDSAYVYVNKSILQYDTLPVREREHMGKFPIDSLILHSLKNNIDSAAFARAKKENTENAYIRFITAFPTARQLSSAIELRDEVSFLEALKTNTYQGFQNYLQRYPNSHRADEAMSRYEKLLYEEKTKSRKLTSYKSFVKEFPKSPYVPEARKHVFEMATASGEPDDFFSYLSEYPESNQKKWIGDLLFHIFKEREEAIPSIILSDSLKRVMELDERFWIPFLKNGTFGFMDQSGTELLPPQFQHIPEEYKCGPVTDDILNLPDGYYSRSGKRIAAHSTSLASIGSGFLTVKENDCLKLIHKSGRTVINDCYDEFRIIDDHFITARKNENVFLFTLSGRQLPVAGITNVEHAEGLIVLTRLGKKIINTRKQLASLVDGNLFQDELVFDEVLAVDENLLLVRNSGLEGIIDTNLNYIVPLDRHTLTRTSFGWIENRNDRISIYGLTAELEKKTFDNITYYRNWLVLQDDGKVSLLDIPSKRIIESDADSVWFNQRLAFIKKDIAQKVYLSAAHAIDLPADSRIQFIHSRDSVQFFYTDNKKKHTVFTLDKGEQLFATEYQIEESLGQDYFIVSKGSKKGLLGRNGKTLVPVEMETILLTDKYHLSLLKEKKFGVYDLKSRKYFKPVYERNMVSIGNGDMVVYKDGYYGLIDQAAKPITGFEFSEVLAWQDSLIWVKKDLQWKLLNYHSKKVLMERVKSFTWISNTEQEKILRINRDNYYGIISNRSGIIIGPTFTEIINIGSSDQPFYFTEKQVEEAGIFVVIYFDASGKLVRKQVYEEEEYDRILCEDH